MPPRSTPLTASILLIALLVIQPALASHPMEGQPAPAVRLKTLDGRVADLSKLKDKIIVLDFWATWCPPCRKGLPLLQQFQDWAKTNKKPVAVFAVNLREANRKVKNYWKDQGFNMSVLMDTKGQTAKAYRVSGIPHTAIIHNGKIASVHVGYSPDMAQTLQSEVEQLLGTSTDSR